MPAFRKCKWRDSRKLGPEKDQLDTTNLPVQQPSQTIFFSSLRDVGKSFILKQIGNQLDLIDLA